MYRRIISICLAVAISGCASAPPKIKETSSGHPEIVVAVKDSKPIRSNLIARNAGTGWVLEQETESTLLFTRTDTSGSFQSAATQVLLGNAYSTPPKYEARYTFISMPEAVRVIVNVFVSTQMPGGQLNRMSLSDAAPTFNPFQAQLEKVKSEIELVKQ